MMSDNRQRQKPVCPLIGQNSNIFNLTGIAARTLKRAGMYKEAEEMVNKITHCGSYYEALAVLDDYVTITSVDDDYNEEGDK